ncbi:MAG: ATP-grasp domain-containing protein [Methylococcaceae bacterium]|nr:ATP-grasp domain-containing protein [Methylococcaceae bacterium]
MKQYKLIILGASNAQLPIIHKALELGYYVITVDNVPDNIGHQFSHEFVNCSTADHEGVLKFAQILKINGIVTFASDIATTTVAFVAKALNLTGCSLDVAKILSNKANFRSFQQAHNLSHPGFFISKKASDIDCIPPQLTPPLIFKPIDTSGSRGITKVEALDLNHYRYAFCHAQQYSRSKTVSIEQFIIGTDVSGDGFLIDGILHAFITQKYQDNFIPTGHSFPDHMNPAYKQRIFDAIESACHAVGYLNGPIDFDVNISDAHVIIIEMSPRLGGNGIPELIRYHTGIDLIAMTIEYALNKPIKKPTSLPVTRPCGSYVFGSEQAGKIDYIASSQEIFQKIPELFSCQLNYVVGDAIPAFEHSGNSLGYALFACSSEDNYVQIVQRLQSALQLRITTQP